MIPNILHFIWFGNTIPDFAYFSMQSFIKNNPTFKINFYCKTLDELKYIETTNINSLQNLQDKLLHTTIFEIKNNTGNYIKQIYRSKYTFKMQFIQVLADVFRLVLLNQYGGIYLDCDTYSIKPFDEYLLNNTCFCVSRHISPTNIIVPDQYMLGKKKDNNYIYEYFSIAKTYLHTSVNWWKNIDYVQNKYRFFKCKSINITNNNFYIEHFNNNAWINNKVPSYKISDSN